MMTVLEQYGFVKTFFDFNSEKVRMAAFWGIVLNLLIMLSGMFNYWANEILGISPAVAIMIFIIMFFDLVTGVSAATYEGQVMTSKKGTRWIFKFGSYATFIYVLNVLVGEANLYGFEWLTYPMNVIKLFVIFTISFMEMKSIDENFERMGMSFQIFKFLDPIYRIFKKTIKRNSDIDFDENESDDRQHR